MAEQNFRQKELHERQPVAPGWYVVAQSETLRRKPTELTFNSVPLVAFRDTAGRPAILLDRCPHRNAPLSKGRVQGDRLQCHYHGWEFDGSGTCRAVPGLCAPAEHSSRQVPSYVCREQQGWLWMYSEPGVEPPAPPPPIPCADDPSYLTIRQRVSMPGPVHAVAENALDVPHTAFVHAGLFRGPHRRSPIEVVIRSDGNQVEAQYIGEPRPKGLVGRLLAPRGGDVTHFDRFILPCLAQVEYRIGADSHILTTAALTPREPNLTDLFATVAVRTPLPDLLLRHLVKPVAMHIVRQDVDVLRQQTEQVERFGAEQFVSTEIDVLGLRIQKLLRDAAQGKTPRPVEERHITMLV
jgi:phenylpropionate dioxygenase-like ring-hydroxylating dioxygenase large terminal subunit